MQAGPPGIHVSVVFSDGLKTDKKKKIQRQTKWVINGHTSYCNVPTSERFVYSNYRIYELQKFLKTHVPFHRSS